MNENKTNFYIRLIIAVVLSLSVARSENKICITNNTLTSAGDSYVYISLDKDTSVAIYKMDTATGDLNFVRRMGVGGEPGSLAVDPKHKYLYAAIRSKNSIYSFEINSLNGDLTLLGKDSVGMNPVYVRTDQTGKYLIAAYNGNSKIAVYPIGQTGAVEGNAVQVITTGIFPHSVQVDPSNRYLFVPCRNDSTIRQYAFNDATGALTANSPDRVATPDSTGPRHFAFHTALNVVYFANEYGRSVTAYQLDTSKGTLTAFQTLPMIQPTFARPIAANKGGADIHLTPDNRFLYASNRDPDTLAAYSVDSETGGLTLIEQYATEKMPREFDIDPTGKFLFAGGQGSGKLASYSINNTNGRLTLLHSDSIGTSIVWVLVVVIKDQTPEGVGEEINGVPRAFSLSQNYPNPFNPTTTIDFTLAEDSNVSLKVFDLLGREVATLVDDRLEAGRVHHATLKSSNLATGIYLYRLDAHYSVGGRSGSNSVIRKLMLLK